MNTQHTAPPWKRGRKTKQVGLTVYRDDGPGTNYVRICRNIASEADQFLIAAAPEMLTVLLSLVQDLGELTHDDYANTHLETTYNRVRTVIAQATNKPTP